ncbi:hypothetical protein [Frigoriglobus tundricola]|uniref:Uncharacterized protein n=1 Tax=Frigoriglobus tundricola TaxID=2774151 RepID=A0A6M5YP27_9BACT|nr:hypothetical protein [Frigoriglobus tundricola]QJW94732.1 hypothetical protein FTUN_2254 [Frigoriglobus tundricola]
MWLITLLGSLIGSDVSALGSEHWPEREAATARVKRWGVLAVPALREGMLGESAEVRHRCRELLGPWRRLAWQLEAARVLSAPDMPDEETYFANEELRANVQRLALRAGCKYYPVFDDRCNDEIPAVKDQRSIDAWLILDQFRWQLARNLR